MSVCYVRQPVWSSQSENLFPDIATYLPVSCLLGVQPHHEAGSLVYPPACGSDGALSCDASPKFQASHASLHWGNPGERIPGAW